MKICLQVLAYNVSRTIRTMLKNAAPHVDKIFIAYPLRAWDYRTDYMQTSNSTSLEELRIDLPCDVEIVEGEWGKDEDTRNALLAKAQSEKYDWMIVQDADEFYTKESWEVLRSLLLDEKTSQYHSIQVPYLTFWKSTSFVLEGWHEGIKNGTTTFAIKCNNQDLFFSYSRTSTSSKCLYIDEPCYHYSYVLNDEEVAEKVSSWAHTKDIVSKRLWLNLKWKHWHPRTKMLHPGSPWLWRRAVRFPLPQPDFAAELRTEEPAHHDLDLLWFIIDIIYNLYARCKHFMNSAKRVIRASIDKHP